MRVIILLTIMTYVGACNKPLKSVSKIHYEVLNLSYDSVVYSISYMNENGKSIIKGPISDKHWKSEELNNFENKQVLYLEVQKRFGTADFKLSVFKNGAVYSCDTFDIYSKELIIEERL